MPRPFAVFLFVIGGWFAAAPAPAAAIEGPIRVEGGLIGKGRAAAGGDVRLFAGIPYAAPPLGARRWRPPEPVVAWTGIRRADAFGPSAIQIPRDPRALIYDGPTEFSEDCLTLNIWTGARSAKERRPVFLWIHGGGFTDGAGSLPAYDGGRLAGKGVVVVTINYRLNVFGFLAHPDLSRESPHRTSGNYGFLDMVAAIKWTRRNIAAFGGDPGHIVVGGLSAGSAAASALAISPLVRGDIVGAIAQSVLFTRHSFNGDWPTRAETEKIGRDFLAVAGVRTVEELRSLPSEALAAAYRKLGPRGPGPIVDGWSIPDTLFEAERSGDASVVPVLTGTVADEGSTLGSPATAREMSEKLAWLHRRWADLRFRHGEATFLYLFARVPPLPPGPWLNVNGRPLPARLGAFHGSCKYYSFDSLASRPWPWTEADHRLADLMTSYWANFIARGDPNGPGLPPWPSYRPGPAALLRLDSESHPIASAMNDEKSEFWSKSLDTR